MSLQPGNLMQALRGPITLIVVGSLFALDRLSPYSISMTWPVILIVFGLLTLAARGLGAGGQS